MTALHAKELTEEPQPWNGYPTPQAILDSELPRSRKVELLRSWEEDARGREVADDENMAGPPSQLSAIRNALQALHADAEEEPRPTKHGG